MPAQERKGHRLGSFLLGVFVALLALAAGAWIAGWCPPAGWKLPAIHSSEKPPPRELIGDTERRSLDRVLREHGEGKGD